MASRLSQASVHEQEPQAGPNAVAFLVPGWPARSFSNGVVSYTHNMREVLSDRGLQVYLIANQIAEHTQDDDLRDVYKLESIKPARKSLVRRGLNKLRYYVKPWAEATLGRRIGLEIAKVVQQLRQDNGLQLLQMEESFGWAHTVIHNCDVPVVVRLHGPWFLTGAFGNRKQDGAFLRRVRREGRAIAAAAGVTAPSQDVLDRVRDYYKLPLPNAVAIPIPMIAPPESERWSLEGCDRDRILFIGRFDLLKGGDLVIEAFRRLLERRPQTRLSFVGRDTGVYDQDTRSLQRFQPYVERHLPGAIDDGRIEWLGAQPPDQLNLLRRRALVTVVASRYETFGNTLREAMIMGCPVVSSDAGGLAEVLDDEKNALAFPAGDIEALTRALGRMLDQPELAARLGAQAFADCSNRYDPDRINQETLDFYRGVIARSRR